MVWTVHQTQQLLCRHTQTHITTHQNAAMGVVEGWEGGEGVEGGNGWGKIGIKDGAQIPQSMGLIRILIRAGVGVIRKVCNDNEV